MKRGSESKGRKFTSAKRIYPVIFVSNSPREGPLDFRGCVKISRRSVLLPSYKGIFATIWDGREEKPRRWSCNGFEGFQCASLKCFKLLWFQTKKGIQIFNYVLPANVQERFSYWLLFFSHSFDQSRRIEGRNFWWKGMVQFRLILICTQWKASWGCLQHELPALVSVTVSKNPSGPGFVLQLKKKISPFSLRLLFLLS